MTFTPLPANPAELLEHLSDVGLVQHALAALRQLRARGIDLPPMLIEEIAEVELEIIARLPGGIGRHAPHLLPADALTGIPDAANGNGGLEVVR